jgi:hypothetical protein
MTEEERAAARALLGRAHAASALELATVATFSLLGALLGGLAGAALITLAGSLLHLPYGHWVATGVTTFAILGALLVAWMSWGPMRARLEKTRPLEEDLATGFVEVLDVEAFIAWSEFAAVPTFTLDVGEPTLLSVHGAALADAVAAGRFPCRQFFLVRLPVTKVALSVEPRGAPLPVRA